MKEPISLRNFIKNIKKQNKPKATYSEKPKKQNNEYVSGYGSIGNRKDIGDFVELEKPTDNNYVSGYGSIGNRKDIDIQPKKKLKEWIYDEGKPVDLDKPIERKVDSSGYPSFAERQNYDDKKHEETYDKLEAHHHPDYDTQNEKSRNQHFQDYVGDSSGLNGKLIALHGSGADSYKEADDDSHVSNMDRALVEHENPAPEDHYVYTGLGRGISALDAYKNGKGIHFPAYTSTSTDPDVAQGFAKQGLEKPISEILRIKVPKGSRHGVFLGSTSALSSEKEMILHRNRHVRFVGEPRRNGNHLVYDTELVDHPEQDNHLEKHRKEIETDKEPLTVLKNRNASEEEIHNAYTNGSKKVKLKALTHDKVGKKTLSTAIDDGDPELLKKALQSRNVDSDHIHQVIDSKHISEPEKVDAITDHSNDLDDSHIDKIIEKHGDDEDMMSALASSKNLKSHHIHHFLDHPNFYMNQLIRQHPNLSDEHIHKMIDSDKYTGNTMYGLHNMGKLNAEHNKKIIEKYPDHHVKQDIIARGKLDDDTIDNIIKNGTNEDHYNLSENNSLKTHHVRDLIQKAIDTKNDDMISKLSTSSKLDSDSLHKLYAHAEKKGSSYMKRGVLRNRNASHGLLMKALDDENSGVRRMAIQHENATPEHINKALDDEDHTVRSEAAKHHNANEENLEKALRDKHTNVAETAASNPNLTYKNIHTALDHEDPYVRMGAIMSGDDKVHSDHLDRAIKDPDYGVRRTASRHPNIENHHLEVLEHDEHPNISEYAKQRLGRDNEE
jgi:hypothetical protein